ncbi:TPM domain-containing protein [Pseudorhodoferax sp.]|uniref:TPM domain-containing protein n=1 Tax=Pseudorhodoferax sp. TaxID=1993553 RepID=UPI002DD66356|nr:TPM domain-containing protein [Pseudorhodoferax sp.]
MGTLVNGLLLRTGLLALLLWLLPGSVLAQALQTFPAQPPARVVDQTGTLSSAQQAALENKLAGFEAQAGPQIVVLLVPRTAPEDIASFAQRVGDAWRIGRRDVGDGLLIVVAKDERKIWIAPAKALEGAVPDLAARQIVQNQISPAFRQGDFAGGLNAGVDALMARIQGEHLPAPPPGGGGRAMHDTGGSLQNLLIFLFIVVPMVGSALRSTFGRRLGSLITGAGTGALAWVALDNVLIGVIAGVVALVVVGILGIGSALRTSGKGSRGGYGGPVIWGGGHSGGWNSSGGGGGFSSGGGGDFGGGGAGGDW